ncbi:MAG TPA: hypothetical protein VHG89_03745 [Verrucomicrobiae bacterium]|nr:hypothetical protein [Verrucomicrobiae bacterium]
MKIKVTIQGVSPLLCNRFTESAELSNGTSPAIKTGKKGTPREQAALKVYSDESGNLGIPGANIMAAIVSAGRFIKAGKSKLTTQKSSLVPAGLTVEEIFLPLTPQKWEVDSRSVVIPSTGGRIMCFRPRFDNWRLSFTLDVDETFFAPEIVRQLLDEAGKKIGLGDWRLERRGAFGKFLVKNWKQ